MGSIEVTQAARRRTAGCTVLLLASMFLTGCGVLPGKSSQIPVRDYTLNAGLEQGASESGAAANNSCISAQVLLPRSASGYNTSRMAYLEQANRIEYFAYSQWADTPAYMLQPLLVHALAQSGKFQHAVMAPSSVGNRFRLESDGLALVQQFSGGTNTVRLSVRVRLIDAHQGKFLFDEVIALERAAASADPIAGVTTANQLASELMRRISDAVTASLNLESYCPSVTTTTVSPSIE